MRHDPRRRLAASLAIALMLALVLDRAPVVPRGVAAAALTRYPYIQNLTTTSVAISWNTDTPSRGRVEIGAGSSFDAGVDVEGASTRHRVTLSGLKPGTRYTYRVLADGRPLTSGDSFRTAPLGDTPFTFVVLGDSGSGDANQRAVAAVLYRLAPDLILHTGDLIYPNSNETLYETRFFAPYRDIIRSIPLYPAMGNHDLAEDGGAAYLGVFVTPRNNPERSERYYSFDYAGAHFVSIDAYLPTAPGTPQYQWLEQDLAATQRFWRFAFLHPPPYSTGEHGSQIDLRDHLSPLFERYGVAVVFAGHDHIYERTGVRRDFLSSSRGVTYVVTGGGGGDLYRTGSAPWVAASRSAHHLVKVSVSRAGVVLEAVAADGSVFDRFAISHPLANVSAILLPPCGRR